MYPLAWALPLLIEASNPYVGAQKMTVPNGSYVIHDVHMAGESGANPFANLVSAIGKVTMTIDTTNLKLSVKDANGHVVEAPLVLRPESAWWKDCFTMGSHALTPVYDVKVETLHLGTEKVFRPVLSAKCGGRPMMWSAVDPGAPEKGKLIVWETAR
jgi:hypothetical protein